MTVGYKTIYLDYHATTPCDERVVAAMMPYFSEHFGNVASSHEYASTPKKAIFQARQNIAQLLNCKPNELYFTSGATESNNLALKGFALANQTKGKHLITTPIEHKSVLDTLEQLKKNHGFDFSYVKVDSKGRVDLVDLEKIIRKGASGVDRTIMMSVIFANNEIGTIQDIKSISKILKNYDVALHIDAVQAVGKIPIDVKELGLSFLSLSGHKMYGPKGIGALYACCAAGHPKLEPLLTGGGQENGVRSGTIPVPLVVGLGKAAELAQDSLIDQARLKSLSQRFLEGVRAKIPRLKYKVNGDLENKLAGNVSLTLQNVSQDVLEVLLNYVAVSSTSACSAASGDVSHVLKAIGLSDSFAARTIRFGFGKFTTESEIDLAIEALDKSIQKFGFLD